MGYDIGPVIGVTGEAEYKKAISELTSTQKTLTSELKVMTSQFNSADDSEAAMVARSRILNQQIDTQREKLSLLKTMLASSTEKYGEADEKTKKWQQAVNNATTELNKLESQSREANSAVGKLSAEILNQEQKVTSLKKEYTNIILEQGQESTAATELKAKISGLSAELTENKTKLNNAEKAANELGNETKQLGTNVDNAKAKTSIFGDVLKGSFVSNLATNALSAIVNGIKQLASKAMETADNLMKLSSQTKFSTTQLQKMQYQSDDLGVSLETQTSALSKMINNMSSAAEGSGTAYKAFKKLGVDAVDPLTGQLRDSTVVYGEVMDALKGVANETDRTAIAQDIFGKSAAELNPLIDAGSAGLKALGDAAEASGAIMSEKAVTALDTMGDTVDHVKQSVTAYVGEGLAAMIGSSQTASETMDELNNSLSQTTNTQALIDKYRELSQQLDDTSLSTADVESKTTELNQVKQDLIDSSNGVVTAMALENGTFGDQVDMLEELNETQREYYKYQLITTVAENNGTEAIRKKKKAQDDYNEAYRKLVATQKAVSELQKKIASGDKEGLHEWQLGIDMAQTSLEIYNKEMADASAELAQIGVDAENSEKAIASLVNGGYMSASEACLTFGLTAEQLNDILGVASGVISTHRTDMASLADETNKVSTATKGSSDSIVSSMQDVRAAYKETYDAAEENIEGQIDLFEEFDGAAKTSIENITQTMLNQKAAMEQYADNLTEAARRGVDDGLIAKLSDGSEESAQILAAIVAGSDEEIAALNDAFEGVDEGVEYFSNAVAGMAEDANQYDLMYQNGVLTADGFIAGIKSRVQVSEDTGASLGAASVKGLKNTVQVRSPSRVTMQIGKYFNQGYTDEIEKGQDAAEKASTKLANSAIAGLKKSQAGLSIGIRTINAGASSSASASATARTSKTAATQDGISMVVHIGTLNNNTDKDIEKIANELAFYTQKALAGGGRVVNVQL